MNLTFLQSPILAPVRYAWRAIRRIKMVRDFVGRCILFPRLPHIRHADNYPAGPVLIAGFFSSGLGLGEAARLHMAQLQTKGVEVYGIDISPAFDLQDIHTDLPLCSHASAPKQGMLILHCNAPETGRVLQYLGRELTADRPIVGYWAWELEVAPPDWYRAYDYLDELWVLSHFTAQAFSQAPIPVKVVPCAVQILQDGGHSLVDLGLPTALDTAHRFLCMADCRSGLVRKNILGTVHAFIQAFGKSSHTALIVKLHHTENSSPELQKIYNACASYPNIYIMDSLLSAAERNSLLHRCHTVVSLHRAEGFGLMLAEALQLGKNAIATAYSGNMDFMNAHNSMLIPFIRVPVVSDNLNYEGYERIASWAEPDIAAAAQAMQSLVNTHNTQQNAA